MPTILNKLGFRFFFYSNENNEPAHIYIEKGDAESKIWLEPEIREEYSMGFSPKEKKTILDIIKDNLELLKNKWNEFFRK